MIWVVAFQKPIRGLIEKKMPVPRIGDLIFGFAMPPAWL